MSARATHSGRSDLPKGFIFDLAGRASLKLLGSGPKRRLRCPFHDDRHPSAFVSEDNLFFCSVCTPDGGWTAKRFCQELGLPWTPPTSGQHTGRPDRTAFTASDARHAWLLALGRARDDEVIEHDRSVYRFLEGRGLAVSWEDALFAILAVGMPLHRALLQWPANGYRLVVPLYELAGELSVLPGAAAPGCCARKARRRDPAADLRPSPAGGYRPRPGRLRPLEPRGMIRLEPTKPLGLPLRCASSRGRP